MVAHVKVSFKPLWKLLIDKDMKYKDFIEKTNIGKSTFYKLKNNENVTTDILMRICSALDCDIIDIMRCEKDEEFENDL